MLQQILTRSHSRCLPCGGRQGMGTHSLLSPATQAAVHSLLLEQVSDFWVCHNCVLGFQSAGCAKLSISQGTSRSALRFDQSNSKL